MVWLVMIVFGHGGTWGVWCFALALPVWHLELSLQHVIIGLCVCRALVQRADCVCSTNYCVHTQSVCQTAVLCTCGAWLKCCGQWAQLQVLHRHMHCECEVLCGHTV